MEKHDQRLQNVLYQVSLRSRETLRKLPGQNIRPVTSQNTEHRNEKLGSIQVTLTTKGLED